MSRPPEEIRTLARSHSKTAIRTLAGIMRRKDTAPSVRIAAAVALLDRGWGKPTTAITVDGTITLGDYFAALDASEEAEDDPDTSH